MYIVLTVVVIALTSFLYGKFRWTCYMRNLRERLETTKVPIESKTHIGRELDQLPAPVRRYFRSVLKEGQPIVASVDIEHTGSFNMGEKWKAFTSTERVITRCPGFDWQARIAIAPGLHVHVHDAYIMGEGFLDAAIIGVVPILNQRDRGELARGELMRFLAESAWYPTALLARQGVRWEPVDGRSAQATLRDDDLVVTLLFRFNDDGLIDTVRAESRGRTVGANIVSTPWQGRFWNYEIRNGMLIPLDAEVAWILPEGEKPYWRGHIIRVNHEFVHEPPPGFL